MENDKEQHNSGETAVSPPAGLDRRTFLTQATVVTTGLLVSSAVAAPVIPHVQPDVVWVARFLTGKADISEDLVKRAYDALLAEYPGFDQKLKTLTERIRAAQLKDVEAFKTSPLASDKDLMTTAIAVISALYTGRVGKGYAGHFVAYKEALMYRPTADVTVIPTYANRPIGYWAEAPKA